MAKRLGVKRPEIDNWKSRRSELGRLRIVEALLEDDLDALRARVNELQRQQDVSGEVRQLRAMFEDFVRRQGSSSPPGDVASGELE